VAITYLGLGSNLGDRRRNIEDAIKLMAQRKDIKVSEVSSLYETEPVGYEDQRWFINGVLKAETTLKPRKLLEALKEIEGALGRKRDLRWGPRIVDLDILLYDDKKIKDQDFVIPHPEMHRRAFVLVPLAEIASDLTHSVMGRSIAELLATLPQTKVVKRIG
jgi:2-amino-4-hydroxy-6-hydroxymethyldihydropteridine diphosphokinase